MNVESTRMVDEITLARVISGQFESPQLIARAPFSFAVTYSDLS
jgi:hypothetical protein